MLVKRLTTSLPTKCRRLYYQPRRYRDPRKDRDSPGKTRSAQETASRKVKPILSLTLYRHPVWRRDCLERGLRSVSCRPWKPTRNLAEWVALCASQAEQSVHSLQDRLQRSKYLTAVVKARLQPSRERLWQVCRVATWCDSRPNSVSPEPAWTFPSCSINTVARQAL